MTGKKPTALSLNELWDLEDEYTAAVGTATGAKIAQSVMPLPGKGVDLLVCASLPSRPIDRKKRTISENIKIAMKKRQDARRKKQAAAGKSRVSPLSAGPPT